MEAKLAMRAVVTSLAALCGAAASADQGVAPTEARRVRITASGFRGEPLTGDLIANEETKLTLRQAGSSNVIEIPRGDVTRLEVSTKRSRKGRAAGIGALVGLGVGVAVGYAAGEDCSTNGSLVCISRPASATGAGLAGAGLGAVLGLAFAPGEKWEVVDPSRVQLTVAPSPVRSGGIGLTLSVGF